MDLKGILKKDYVKKLLQKFLTVSAQIKSIFIEGVFRKDFIIGLDIGTSSIKITQFRKLEDELHLIRADLREIKQTGDNIIREKEILSVLKDLFRGIDVKKSKFIVSINCPKTAITKVTVPYMPKAELIDGIRLEAKNYFPFPIDQAHLDSEIVGEIIEKGVKKLQLLIATSPQKTINGYLSLLEKVGIKPASFVPSPYALQKLVESSLSKEDKIHCLVDIGSHFTELAIFSAEGGSASGGKGKNLIFSRKIPVAGSEFTKAMTGVLVSDKGRTELTLDEAENIKRQIGIPPKGEPKMIGDKISTTQILSMLMSPLEQLVNEIERCFDYYREEVGGDKVDLLILFGAGASLKGLSEFLSKELGIEVKMGNPLENLKIELGAIPDKENISHRLAFAIGAALSEAKGINLLPPEIKEETRRAFKRSGIEAAVVGTALVLILFYIGMRIQLNNFQKKISVAKMELSSLGPQLKQVAIFGLLAKEPYWDDVFKELSNIIPSDIYLTELSMENNIIRMHGIVSSQEPEESLSNFILTLERGLFKNVKLITTKEITGKTANEFEITCWIDEK